MRGILTASSYAARGWAGLQARSSQPVCAARPPFQAFWVGQCVFGGYGGKVHMLAAHEELML